MRAIKNPQLSNQKTKQFKMLWPSTFNTLASGWFRGFSGKKRLNTCGFVREFLQSGMIYRPGKSLKKTREVF